VTVFLEVPVTIRPYRGQTEPGDGMPLGYWVAHALVIGDASGGAMQIFVRTQETFTQRVSLLYSLEELMVHVSLEPGSGLAQDFLLQILEMDRQPLQGSPGIPIQVYTFRMDDEGTQRIGQSMRNPNALLPIFMGQPNKGIVPSGPLVEKVNLDLDRMSVKMGGYYWGPGSINADGGPKRPLTGLYARGLG